MLLLWQLLIILWMSIQNIQSNSHSVLERYEQRLNSALARRNSGSRTVKRYKCVEEYVTYDANGHTIETHQGPKYTTTMEPPVYRTSGEREIRRKPIRKVTIAINRDEMETTTPMTQVRTTTTVHKAFDEMNDEEADRIIEEMYLKKKESHSTDPPIVAPPPSPEVITVDNQQPIVQQSRTYSTVNDEAGSNKVISTDDREDDYQYNRRSRKRPYEISGYDDYDDIPLYRPYRRDYRLSRRRRPLMFDDEFTEESDFDRRLSSSPHRQLPPQIRPQARQQIPYSGYQHSGYPPAPPLPISASTNMMQRQMPLPITQGTPPGSMPLQPIQPIVGVMGHQNAMAPSTNQLPQLTRQQIPQAQEMQEANQESCAKITKLSKNFGIKDVSSWARSNCPFLQMYAPTASCELIFHFIDSCKTKNFF